MGKIVIGCLVVAISATIMWVSAGYEINRDIEGWKSRAQVSSEPNDMLRYMTLVSAGMERRGMISGSAALILKTPENDMSLIYRTVQQHIDQAKILTSMDRSSPEYQTGLDNLRGSIRELNIHAVDFWSAGGGFIIQMLCTIGWLSAILLGGVWLDEK